MSMQIDPERIASGDLTREEIIYLQDRAILPAHIQPINRDAVTGDFLEQQSKRFIEDLTIEEIEDYLEELRDQRDDEAPKMTTTGGELEDDDDGDADGDNAYSEMTNPELRAELAERALVNTGKKQELIDRLLRSDNDELTEEDTAAV